MQTPSSENSKQDECLFRNEKKKMNCLILANLKSQVGQYGGFNCLIINTVTKNFDVTRA